MGLISDSVRQVDEGTQLVHAAGGTTGEIVQSVQQVATIIGEISTAAREQTTGLSQVSEAVSHLDQMTQQNAALVEENAASAMPLNGQAQSMTETVQVFRIDASAPNQARDAVQLRKEMKASSERGLAAV